MENIVPTATNAIETITNKYVAFCDILGFSNKLAHDFDKTLDVYRRFGERLDPTLFPGVELTVYSDAILLTCDELWPLLKAVQILWFVAMTEDLMIRGGISYGRYWERRQGGSFMVVSDALVSAVKIEASVGVPAVVLADDIELDLEYWVPRFQHGPLFTPLLHFRDRNIVNPFSPMWGVSASVRATMMMNESPAHKEKYLWFLALYKAVSEGETLVPGAKYNEMIKKGILKWIPPENEASP
ncbi:hypothetical protein [Pandoraea sp.]|uniref:hypothetical protein n=1 Tax=Pandoraea sp. TaxID=1883445 RepID=UPI0035AF3563